MWIPFREKPNTDDNTPKCLFSCIIVYLNIFYMLFYSCQVGDHEHKFFYNEN